MSLMSPTQRARVTLWVHDNIESMGWTALAIAAVLITILAGAMTKALRDRSLVILQNDSGVPLRNITVAVSRPAPKERRHTLPSLPPNGRTTFVVFPQAPSEINLAFADSYGDRHQWRGGLINPKRGYTRLKVDRALVVSIER